MRNEASLTYFAFFVISSHLFVCCHLESIKSHFEVFLAAAYLPSWSPAARTRTRCPFWSPLALFSAWSRFSRGCCPPGPPASLTRSPCCPRRRQPGTQHWWGGGGKRRALGTHTRTQSRARTHEHTPLSFQIYRLRFTPPRLISSMPVRERQPESRWGRAEALEEKSRRKLPARSSSRGCRGAAGGRSCQQKRKVSIKVKLDAGWSHFRSTFGINVIIWSHCCWEMVIMVFKCQMAPLATASSLRVYQRNSVFYAINVSNI